MRDDETLLEKPSGSGSEEELLISELLHLGGRRPAIPVERERIIRAAVEAEWRRAIPRRRVFALTVAAGFGVIALTLFVARLGSRSYTAGLHPAPELSLLDVRVLRVVGVSSHDGRSLAQGEVAGPGEYRTAPDGRLALEVRTLGPSREARSCEVRLDARSAARVTSGPVPLRLIAGSIYVDSGAGASGASLPVETPFGTVWPHGTQFEARLTGDGLRLRVREGTVSLRSDEREEFVEGGAEFFLSRDGTLRRGRATPADPGWRWVSDVAPPYRLEGHTLSQLLAWASRETGRRVRYSESAVAGRSSRAVLHGDREDLSPEDLVKAIAPTAGLTATITPETITVSAGPERR